jgi:hypothetical protein
MLVKINGIKIKGRIRPDIAQCRALWLVLFGWALSPITVRLKEIRSKD